MWDEISDWCIERLIVQLSDQWRDVALCAYQILNECCMTNEQVPSSLREQALLPRPMLDQPTTMGGGCPPQTEGTIVGKTKSDQYSSV